MRTITWALLLLACGCSGAGQTQTAEEGPREYQEDPRIRPVEPPRREKLYALLKAEGIPTEQQLRAMGTGIDSDLANVINERQLQDAIRVEAITCMGYFQNKRAELLLRGILTDPYWEKPFRQAALLAIARSQGAEAFETFKEYSQDPEADMRLAAVQALERLGTPAALSLLKSLQLSEREPNVIKAIDSAIRGLDKSILEGP
jgi:hypothetical protein